MYRTNTLNLAKPTLKPVPVMQMAVKEKYQITNFLSLC